MQDSARYAFICRNYVSGFMEIGPYCHARGINDWHKSFSESYFVNGGSVGNGQPCPSFVACCQDTGMRNSYCSRAFTTVYLKAIPQVFCMATDYKHGENRIVGTSALSAIDSLNRNRARLEPTGPVKDSRLR